MRIIRCDRCGKDIDSKVHVGKISVHLPMRGKTAFSEWDFCPACLEEIIKVIKNEPDPKAPEPEPGPDPDQEEPEAAPEEPPKKRGRVDLRELRELVKADKTPQEIADHFGVSVSQYYRSRKKAEQLYIEGNL